MVAVCFNEGAWQNWTMKLLLFGVSFPLLLSSFLLGKDSSNWAQPNPSLVLGKEEDRVSIGVALSIESKHTRVVEVFCLNAPLQ